MKHGMVRRALMVACIAAPCLAQARAQAGEQVPPVLQAMRQRDWAAAERFAGDALGRKLVAFIRMLSPHQASADEIRAFTAENPDFPDQAVLRRRYAEALGEEPDMRRTDDLCRSEKPVLATALLHCAEAAALSGDPARAKANVRDAWVLGITQPVEEAGFLARWGSVPTHADQRTRFERLAETDPAAAARQVPRLDGDYARLAAARLAFVRQDTTALSFLPSIPEKLRADPALLLDEARYLRRTHAEDAALALWRGAAIQAEAASPAEKRAAFWAERDVLAHRLLESRQAQDAYALADDADLPEEAALDADFLAGFIALRSLQNPVLARPHFARLLQHAHSAISLSRAAYWLGRAAPDAAAAQGFYRQAAVWKLTYYGQLATRALGESESALRAEIAALRDPVATPAEEAAFASDELVRAAAILVSWQDPRRAADFLLKRAQAPASGAARALAAAAALRQGLPDVAVQIARMAGRDGMMLPQSGWPMPVQPLPGPVAPALVLGVMRQESSFDPKIVSTAGAHGLMQVMPQTAAELARADHGPGFPLEDPDINMRLGTAYLAGLLQKFDGVVPYAVAAYDAGPHRVSEWIAANGTDDMTDWIEMIPFAETRSYVQRVMENTEVYTAKRT